MNEIQENTGLTETRAGKHIAYELVLDVDETIYPRELFAKRKTKFIEAKTHVSNFVSLYDQVVSSAVSQDSSKSIEVTPHILTARTYTSFLDSESPLHPLLNLKTISSLNVSNVETKSTTENHAMFYCENGAVVLARKEQLKGEFRDVGEGWAVQVNPEYANYCNTTRKIIIEAITELNILEDSRYHFESGDEVMLCIQSAGDRQITNSEKEEFIQKINDWMIEHNYSEMLGELDFSLGHDFDISPKSMGERKKQLGIDRIVEESQERNKSTKDIKYIVIDDADDAVGESIEFLHSHNATLALTYNADEALKKKTSPTNGDVISSYETSLGTLGAVHEGITGEHLLVSWKEIEKVKKCRKKQPIIVSIGKCTDDIIDYYYKPYVNNRTYRNNRNKKFARFSSIVYADEIFFRDNRNMQGLSPRNIEGMNFIVSFNRDNPEEVDHVKHFFEQLNKIRKPQSHPVNIILIEETKDTNKLNRRASTSPDLKSISDIVGSDRSKYYTSYYIKQGEIPNLFNMRTIYFLTFEKLFNDVNKTFL